MKLPSRLALLSIFFRTFIFHEINAQPVYFQKIFGDSAVQCIGKTVLQAVDGHIYFTGNFNDFGIGIQGIEMTKLDASGNINWKKPLITAPAYVNRSLFTSNETILINGQLTDSIGNTDALVMETDTAGNVISLHTYGDPPTTEAFQALLQTSDGGYIFAGFTTNPSGPGNAFWIVKADSAFNEQWQQTYSYNVNSTCDDVVQTIDGGYLIAGDKKTTTSNYNSHAIKIDSAGNIEWETDLVNQFNSGCKNLITASDGNFVIIGETATATSAYFDPYITKLDTSGNILWAHNIPCSNNGDAGYDIIEPVPGHFLITGFGYNSASVSADLLLMRLDSAGNEVSRRYYGNSGYDQGFTIISNNNNTGFMAAGFITEGGNNRYFLVHDDLLGISTASTELTGEPMMNVFPSPADQLVSIKVNGIATNSNLRIYDLNGRVVFSKKITDTQTIISTAAFPPGLYLLHIENRNKHLFKKFPVMY